MKKWIAIVTLVTMFGCSLAWSAPVSADEAAGAILQDCAKAMEQVKNLSVTGALTVGVEGLISAETYDKALVGELFVDPPKVHFKVDVMGNAIEVYGEDRENKMLAYIKTGYLWKTYSRDVALGAPSGGIDITSMIQGFNVAADLRVEDAAEPIDGKAVRCVGGTIDLHQFVDQKAIDQILTATLVPMGEGLLPADAALPVGMKVYVEAATGNLLRIQIDLSQAISTVLTAAIPSVPGKDAQKRSAQFLLNLDLSNFNQTADFEIPAEAKQQ